MNQLPASTQSAPSKSDFQALVQRLRGQLALIDSVYPAMIASAQSFDRELAKKIEAAMQADRALLEYVQSKAESQQALPPIVVAGLLGG